MMDLNEAIEHITTGGSTEPGAPLLVIYNHVRSLPLTTHVRDLQLPLALLDILVDYMEDRAAVVLPCTQDNADLQENWVPPLTDLSGMAAALYAEVLCRAGALTWVQMQAVASLANVLQRWRVMMQGEKTVTNEEDWGMRVARAVTQVPSQKEFGTCWPLDAVETILQAVISTVSTAHALKESKIQVELGRCISYGGTTGAAIQGSNIELSELDDDIGGSTNNGYSRKHRMVVAVLRSLYPILLRKEELPNGEIGKSAAAKSAETVLKDMISGVQELSTPSTTRKRPSLMQDHTLDSRFGSVDTKTPKPNRARRLSRTPRSRRSILTPRTKSKPRSPSSAPSRTHSPPSLLSAVVGMLQKLTTSQDLQKANLRANVADLILSTLEQLGSEEKLTMICFLEKLCLSKMSVHRLVAGELIGKLMSTGWMKDDIDDGRQSQLLATLEDRLSDKVATVRAATCLAIASIVKNVELNEEVVDLGELSTSLRSRALLDDKANVRRAACNTLVAVLDRSNDASPDDISVLSELCADDSVLMRRAAAEGLTSLLEQRPELAAGAWAEAVLPLMHDPACSAKATELIDRVILQPILASTNDELAWKVLSSLETGTGRSQNQMDALCTMLQGSACARLFRCLKENAIKSLGCDETYQVAVWRLFLAASGKPKDRDSLCTLAKRSKVDFSFLGTCMESLLEGNAPVECVQSCLGVWTQLARCVDMDAAQGAAGILRTRLSDFELAPGLIGSAISALTAITLATSNNKDECTTWIRELYGNVNVTMSGMIRRTVGDHESNLLSRAMITAGELCLVGFSPTEEQGCPDAGVGDSTILACGLHERPPSNIVDLTLSFMTNELPGLEGVPVPHTVRAHAFTAAGKVCLRDSRLAKKILNMLAQELHSDSHWRVQSNALIIMGDLCVRYTNMADKFLPNMAACLQAGASGISSSAFPATQGSAVVRKHALLILSSLLLQDYIKWRGLLFYRFLIATIDVDETVASLADSLLNGPLLGKQPDLYPSKFVESLFVLNQCTAHSICQSASVSGDGGSGIAVGLDGVDLKGELGRSYRMSMYEMMLSHMTDKEKIEVTARLGKDVFGNALKVGGELHEICISEASSAGESCESAHNVLRDAFAILRNPAIRVGKRVQTDDGDIEDPNVTVDKTQKVQAATGRLLSNVSRKHLIETLLPILINLKALLEENHSPLLKELMVCLLDVFKRFKSEAKECLANDPTVLEELEFDSRKQRKSIVKSTVKVPKPTTQSGSATKIASPLSQTDPNTPKRQKSSPGSQQD